MNPLQIPLLPWVRAGPVLKLNFIGCFNFDHKVFFQRQTVPMRVILSREKVPSYFTHRTTGNSLTNIPLPHISPSQPFFIFKACALCDVKSLLTDFQSLQIQLRFRFVGISRNRISYGDLRREYYTKRLGGHLVKFDCAFPLNKDVSPLADHVDIQFRLTEAEIDYAV